MERLLNGALDVKHCFFLFFFLLLWREARDAVRLTVETDRQTDRQTGYDCSVQPVAMQAMSSKLFQLLQVGVTLAPKIQGGLFFFFFFFFSLFFFLNPKEKKMGI